MKSLASRWPLLVLVVAAALIAWVVLSDRNGGSAAGTTTTTTVPATTTSGDGAVTTTSTPDGAFVPEFEPGRCRFDVPPGRDVECGWVALPENRSDPGNDRMIRLHVAVFRSDSPTPEPDPLIYLAGGPGSEELETVALAFEDAFAPFLAERDFIMFDQRGVGFSEPALSCPQVRAAALDLLDDDVTDVEAEAVQYEAYRECRDDLVADGVDLAAYNTVENAADVADLRVALGYDEWNLLGISYGTRLALEVMRDHPEGIRSVVLDSVFPHQVDSVVEAPAAAQRSFATLAAGCAADPGCAAAYPDLEEVLWEQVTRFDADPLMLQIVYVDGRRFDALLDGEALVGVVFQSLYSAEVIPLLPGILYDIAGGDYLDLTTLVGNFISVVEFVSFGMHTSVQCREESAFSGPDELAAAAAAVPGYGALFVDENGSAESGFALCSMWGAGAAGPLENTAVTSGIPALVLAGEYDPVTPPDWGRQAAVGLSSGYFFEFPGLGHAVSVADACPLGMVLAFLDDPGEAPEDGCIAAMPGPDFTGSGSEATGPIVLVPFTTDQVGVEVSGLVPAGWEDNGFGVYLRARNALDQTAIVQQAIAGGSIDFTVNLIAGQLGIEGDLDDGGDIVAGDRVWSLYRGSIQGYLVDLAIADGDPYGILVLLVSQSGERDALFGDVLVPVLGAVTVR